MGHGIPAPYGRIFYNLMVATADKIISREQGHKTWECVCEAWQRNHPESYCT